MKIKKRLNLTDTQKDKITRSLPFIGLNQEERHLIADIYEQRWRRAEHVNYLYVEAALLYCPDVLTFRQLWLYWLRNYKV